MLGDGSTGWHIAVGNYIIDKHVIPHTDMLSYTFFGKPWLDFEWLADVVMAFLVKLGGLNLLNVVAASFIALLLILLYHRCRKTGCHFVFAIVLTLLGGVASSLHWLARPHLFTFLGVYLFSTKLEDFSKGTISGAKLLFYLTLTMLFWVNCHGGFLAGFGLLAIYLICYFLQSLIVGPTDQKKIYQNGVKWLSLSLLTTFAASLCNPYFLELYGWLFKHLQQKTILDLTNEYASPVFHGDIACISLALLFALYVIGVVVTKNPVSLSQLMSSLAFAYMSLSAMRHFPLFAIVVVPQIAQLFSKTIFAPDRDKPNAFQLLSDRAQGMVRSFDKWNVEFTENERLCCMHILPVLVFAYYGLASLNGGNLLGQSVIHTTFDEAHKPTVTLKEIETAKLDPKQGLGYDNWGGYLSYRLGIPVFIDDRVPLYGEKFFLEYASVFDVGPEWKNVVKKYGITWILMPNDSRIVSVLGADPEWRLAAKDDASSLYVMKTSARAGAI